MLGWIHWNSLLVLPTDDPRYRQWFTKWTGYFFSLAYFRFLLVLKRATKMTFASFCIAFCFIVCRLHKTCWWPINGREGDLTNVSAETRCNVERHRQGEVAGGCVEAGLQMPAMTRDTDRLSWSSLILLVDFLLTLQTHWVLRSHTTDRHKALTWARTYTWAWEYTYPLSISMDHYNYIKTHGSVYRFICMVWICFKKLFLVSMEKVQFICKNLQL